MLYNILTTIPLNKLNEKKAATMLKKYGGHQCIVYSSLLRSYWTGGKKYSDVELKARLGTFSELFEETSGWMDKQLVYNIIRKK